LTPRGRVSDIKQYPRPRQGTEGARAKLIVSGGSKQGLEPGDVIGAIVDHSHLHREDITNVRLLERFSVVEVPAERADEVASAVTGNTAKGVALKLEVAKGSSRPARTAMRLSYRRLLIGLVIAAWVTALIVALDTWAPLTAIAGVPLVLVLPGTLATYAVLPHGTEVDGRLRVILAIALSAGIALAVGLSLASATGEVPRVAAAVTLAGVCTVGAVAALFRARSSAAALSLPRPGRVPVPEVVGASLLACALVVLVVAALNTESLPAEFTTLALTQDRDHARLDVENREARAMTYRYRLYGDGRLVDSGVIDLDEGEDRTVLLTIPPGVGELVAGLYAGSGRPYRSVSLRVRG